MASFRQTVSGWFQRRPVDEETTPPERTRASLGLPQFVAALEEVEHPAVLDLGRVWQATVAFFTRRHCKLYTEDLFQAVSDALAETRAEAPPLAERFLAAALPYPEESVRGILAWDVFDYLPDELVEPLAARLSAVLEPGGVFLGLFHNRLEDERFIRYRVLDEHTFELVPGVLALRRRRAFANRALVNLFSGFRSSRTFVGRDNLRELFLLK
ncbi:MAG: class I SAM-dependent methyltransferase [Acidobacteria bacterium]|nr:class I SAM-dependent methyltransferase [Acidobacteriota bacterium]